MDQYSSERNWVENGEGGPKHDCHEESGVDTCHFQLERIVRAGVELQKFDIVQFVVVVLGILEVSFVGSAEIQVD